VWPCGFSTIGVGVETNELPFAEGPDSGVIALDLLGAPLTAPELVRELKNPVSEVDDLLCL
jgi:hypothetical protein